MMDDEDAADVKDCWDDSDGDDDIPAAIQTPIVNVKAAAIPKAIDVNEDDDDDDDTTSISSASTVSGAGDQDGPRGGFFMELEEDDELSKDENDLIEVGESGSVSRIDKAVEVWLLKYAKRTALNASFSENNSFLIDFDSLLLQCLEDSTLPWDANKVQALHVVYLLERYLKFFIDKGGNFEFVVFEQSEVIWRDCPVLLFVRWSIVRHLESCSNIRVLHFRSCFCDEFDMYVTRINPIFVLTLMSMSEETAQKLRNPDVRSFVFMTCSSFVKQGLSIALADTIQYTFAHLNAYWIEPVSGKAIDWDPFEALKSLSESEKELSCEGLAVEDTQEKHEEMMQQIPDCNLSVAVIIFQSLKKDFALIEKYAKAFVLAYEVCCQLPFSVRCRTFETDLNSDVELFIEKFSLSAALAVKCLSCKWLQKLTPGFLDMNIFRLVIDKEFDNLPIHDPKSQRFLEMLGCSCEMAANGHSASGDQSTNSVVSKVDLECNFVDISADIIEEYVGDLRELVKHFNTPSAPKIQSKLAADKRFEELYHWHSMAPISDEFARTRDNSDDKKELSLAVGFNRRDQRRQLRRLNAQKQKFVRFMTRYGQSLEGGVTVVTEKIVPAAGGAPVEKAGNQKKKDKKAGTPGAPQKMSKASQKIIERNILEKKAAKDNESRRQMQEFRTKISSLENRPGKLFPELDSLKSYYKDFRCMEKDYTLYITDVLGSILNHTATTMGDFKITLEAKIQVASHIKEIYQLREHWSSKTESVVTKLCCKCAFYDLLDALNLTYKKNPSHEDSFIHFQLRDMGHLLSRDVRSDPDPRISRFIPDTWQRELFDAIDKNQSALIIAPTSSGKTYASYYCMEQILKQDDDGVIVYVSPTKALVNQVAATICARYEKNLPAGRSLYGVFTRDYRQNVKTCQILITVPHCLEILLLSEGNSDWISRVKYVIFDEVHCIGMGEEGIGGGIVWEHCITGIMCPFLALSATVENPDMLHRWLQDAEDFKLARDLLTKTPRKNAPESHKVVKVEYRLRHNDLDHYLFNNKAMVKVHPCSFFDEKTAADYDVCPQHVLLSPSESLELYESMRKVEPQRLSRYDPSSYFKDSLFITKNSVTSYAKELLSELWNWKELYEKKEFLRKFNAVVRSLSDVDQLKLKMQPSEDQIRENFVPLLEGLQENNMLPAIIFCENRHLCEVLVEEAGEYIKMRNREALDVKDDKSREKIQQKAEKLAKKQATKDGKDKNKDSEGSRLDMMMQARDEVTLSQKETFNFAGKSCGEEDKKYAFDRMRLNDFAPTDPFRFGLENGISYHHSGMNAKMRGGVEMLFRLKHLQIVIATGTLAMGIHVPCRTVAFTYDSPYFNTLTFRQMSGRAGRRGFDLKGNVVFTMVPYSKVQSLVTSKLPRLMGNFPISVSLVLRLLLLVAKGDAPQRLTSALTLLNHPLILQHYQISSQLKLHFLFSVQFLYQGIYIDAEAKPLGFTGLVTHLNYHEPANFVFIYLLKRGYFHQLLNSEKDKSKFSKDLMKNLVGVLAHLFTHLPLPKKFDRKFNTSIVHLRDLRFSPGGSYGTFQQAIESYNTEVKKIFDGFLLASSVSEKTRNDVVSLPVSKKEFGVSEDKCGSLANSKLGQFLRSTQNNLRLCSPFVGLSGHLDENLYDAENIVSAIRPELYTDYKVIPIFKVVENKNAYAWDYYNHGSIKALSQDNRIFASDVFNILKDFILVVKAIYVSLVEMTESREEARSDPVVRAFKQLVAEYNERWNKDFPEANIF